MIIKTIASYLIFPGKNKENPQPVQGTMLPLSGGLFNMLEDIFSRSDHECDIAIRFRMAEDGSQNNETRLTLLSYIKDPSMEKGRVLANRLRDYTTSKPGLGLFFLLLGEDGNHKKIVLSRFPADQGILAEPMQDTLKVEFIERIFMKRASSYKAALYQGSSLDSDFWSGFAVDKQLNSPNYEIANYWVYDFLASDFKTTSKAGTKRLAVALREASRSATDIRTKQELVAVSTLLTRWSGRSTSIQDIMDTLNLSAEARFELISHLPHEGLVGDSFQLDEDEFLHHASFASVELNTGGILLAPSDIFDDCFTREPIDEENLEYRFTTEGKIVDERLRGRK